MIKYFLEATDRILTVNESNGNIYGAAGTQTLMVKSGATNIKADTNIENFYFDSSISSYKFQQSGTSLQVFDNNNQLLIDLGVRDSAITPTGLTFANGTVQAIISADATGAHIKVGSVLVDNKTPTAIANLNSVDVTSASGSIFTMTSNSIGTPTAEGKSITFTVTPVLVSKATTLSIDMKGQALNSVLATTTADDFGFSTPIVFNPGDTASKQITVVVNNDGVPEGMEAYKARLVDENGNEKSTVVGTIIDGLPVLNFAANKSTVNEGGDSVNFTVTSDVNAPAGGIAIPYSLNVSAATTGVSTPASGTITIPAGSKVGVLTLQTKLDDGVVKSPENVVVTLTSPTNATLNTNTATTTIVDTSVVMEANKFFFTGSASVNEGGKAVYTISHTPITGASITIPYTVSGSVNSSDYTTTNPSPIVFNIGDSVKTIEFPITADLTAEGNEKFIVTLNPVNLVSDSIAAGQNSINTTIIDSSSTNTLLKLTQVIETITGSEGNDFISAYIDASGNSDTLNAGDVINAGGGTDDTLFITTDGADVGSLPAVTISGVEIINIHETGGGAGNYNLSGISGLSTVVNNASSDDITFNLAPSTKLIIQGNAVSANGNTTFNNSSDLTLKDGVNGGNITRTVTGVSAFTINSVGLSDNTVDTLDLDSANSLTSLTINASSVLTATLSNDYVAGTTITVTGTASKVDLSGSALSSAITTVNASAFAGGVLMQVNQSDKIPDTAFTGGSGNDTLDIGKVLYNTTISINGGNGMDTLKVADQNTLSLKTFANISNFERLEFYDDDDGSVDSFDVSLLKGISTIQLDADSAGDGYSVNNLSADQAKNVIIAGNQTVAPTFNINNALLIGNIDTLGLTIDAGETGNAVTLSGINAPGVELVDVNAVDSLTATSLLGLPALAIMTISGGGDINLTTDKLPLNLNSTIDATASTGMITVNASLATTNGMLIKGSLRQANFLTGSAQADLLTGGAGADLLNGGDGADTLNGGANADILNGGAGSDIINGGAGADLINGGAGIDTLIGGSGDDLFVYATMADLLDSVSKTLVDSIAGGSGTNSLLLGTSGTAVTIALTDIWSRASGIDSLIGVANITANTLTLGQSAETAGVKLVDLSSNTALTGNVINVGSFTATNTTLIGSAVGATSIVGGAGNDTITGGAGSDNITGGAGNDVFNITGGIDTITDFTTGDTLNVSSGATAKILAVTTGGVINMSANTVNNLGSLIIDGSTGGTAAETITGSSSADSITGGGGSDVITGGAGIDTMSGGAGADKFVFSSLVDSNDLDTTAGIVTDEIAGFASGDSISFLGAAGVLSVGVKQVSTITIAGSVESGETVTVTGVSTGNVTVTTAADAAGTATALMTAINSATGATVTATSSAGIVTLTAKLAGTAFTAATSVANGASATPAVGTSAVVATTTPNTPETGNFVKVSVAAASLSALLTAADTALNGTIDYYFGVVGADGYLVTDSDGIGYTDVIKFTGATGLLPADITI